MRTFPVLLALFIVVPLVEIFLFIKVGGAIGALPTVVLVILTALIGVSLLRMQGLRTMARFQQQMASGELPANTMLEGAALLFGGALLLTPGFLTDAIGFLCLIPYTRQTLIHWIMSKFIVQQHFTSYTSSTSSYHDPNIIEGEVRRPSNNEQDH